MLGTRRFILLAVLVSLGVILLFTAGLYWLPEPQNDTLFAGPPQFIVLSLIVALGLYLRQVSVHALELRDKIQLGDAWKGQYQKRYATQKIRQLEKTSETIMLVSPFVILLTLFVGIRIASDDVCRFFYDSKHVPRAFYAGDLVIGIGLLAMLFGLGIAHFVARSRDSEIRALITSAEFRDTLGP
jgi:hypothetical protein